MNYKNYPSLGSRQLSISGYIIKLKPIPIPNLGIELGKFVDDFCF